jgi:hypothetical protein
MPFALLIVGIILTVAGVKGTQSTLFSLVKGDFTGTNNFIYWALSILVVGALGYVPQLRPLSKGFLVLIVVVLFLKTGNPNAAGGGFFAEFQRALGSTASVPTSGAPIDNSTALTSSNVGSVLSSQSSTATGGLSTETPTLSEVI